MKEYLDLIFSSDLNDVAVIDNGKKIRYSALLDRFEKWKIRLADFPPQSVIAYVGEFSADSISLTLACIACKQVAVPLSREAYKEIDFFVEAGQLEYIFNTETGNLKKTGKTANHDLFGELKESKNAGLILFSSGTTGVSKAILHDLELILEKFLVRRQTLRGITFLLLDHIGGVNTLFYQLSNRGTIVTISDRSPESVCMTIEKYKVELLPVSPSFLNLLILSEAYEKYDLSTLKLVTYGTEVMPEWTLNKIGKILPNVKLQQTYGLSELGILRSKSKSNESLFVKVGGEGFETKIRNQTLWVKAKSSMLGYLNAPSPFDDEGWYDTGDLVEEDYDGYIRFLGRKSDVINVGGQKVFPAEVESRLQEIPGVIDTLVYGEKNLMLGQIVVAKIRTSKKLSNRDAKTMIYDHLKGNISEYKIPIRVISTQEELTTFRFKKRRN